MKLGLAPKGQSTDALGGLGLQGRPWLLTRTAAQRARARLARIRCFGSLLVVDAPVHDALVRGLCAFDDVAVRRVFEEAG